MPVSNSAGSLTKSGVADQTTSSSAKTDETFAASGTGDLPAGNSRIAGPSSSKPLGDAGGTLPKGGDSEPTRGHAAPSTGTSGVDTIIGNIGDQTSGTQGSDIIVHQTVVTVRDVPNSSLLANEGQLRGQNPWNSPLEELIESVTTPDTREVLQNMNSHSMSSASQPNEQQQVSSTTNKSSPVVPQNTPLSNALNAAVSAAQFDRINQAWLVSGLDGLQAFSLDGAYLGPGWLLGALSDLSQSTSSHMAASALEEQMARKIHEGADEQRDKRDIQPGVRDTATSEIRVNDKTADRMGPPLESDAGRLISDRENGIRLGDANTCYRDVETGRWAMRAQDGTWQVFDKQGRFSGLWSPQNAARRQQLKIGSKNRVSSGQQPFSCELWGECQREGLPSCCQFRGTW